MTFALDGSQVSGWDAEKGKAQLNSPVWFPNWAAKRVKPAFVAILVCGVINHHPRQLKFFSLGFSSNGSHKSFLISLLIPEPRDRLLSQQVNIFPPNWFWGPRLRAWVSADGTSVCLHGPSAISLHWRRGKGKYIWAWKVLRETL